MGYVERMRRAALWGTVGTMLVLPILACTGGDVTVEPTEVPPPPPPPSNDVSDPAATIQGDWKVFPNDADLRVLKVLSVALDAQGNEQELQNKLTPPPTADEIKQFHDLKAAIKANPDDPSVKWARDLIAMIKNTEMNVTGTEVTLSVEDVPQTWTYTVDSASLNNLLLTLSSNEKLTFVFDSPDTMRLTRVSGQNQAAMSFKRMAAGEGKRGKGGKGGDHDGKAGKGDGGGGGGDHGGGGGGGGKAGKGGKNH